MSPAWRVSTVFGPALTAALNMIPVSRNIQATAHGVPEIQTRRVDSGLDFVLTLISTSKVSGVVTYSKSSQHAAIIQSINTRKFLLSGWQRAIDICRAFDKKE
jgi:hypothetical protein